MASNPIVPTAPVEAPDPFKGLPTSHQEFSDWRRTGELPERFKEAEKPEPPAAPEQVAETVEGKEPSETEQEKQERERDEKGKFAKKVEFSPEQQEVFNREIKRAKAKARTEFEQQLAAKTSETPKVTPTVQEAAAAPESNEPLPPELPNLDTWTGTIAEYNAAAKSFPAKFTAFLDAKRQSEQNAQALNQRLSESEAKVIKEYPDAKELINELFADIQGGAEPKLEPVALQLLQEKSSNPYELTYHLAKNREDFQRLASIKNPVDALVEIVRLDTKLQLSKSAVATPVHAETPAKVAKPRPPEPVGARQSSTAFDVNDDKLDPDTWAKLRNEQVAKARGR